MWVVVAPLPRPYLPPGSSEDVRVVLTRGTHGRKPS